jgi:hypothetical protein
MKWLRNEETGRERMTIRDAINKFKEMSVFVYVERRAREC